MRGFNPSSLIKCHQIPKKEFPNVGRGPEMTWFKQIAASTAEKHCSWGKLLQCEPKYLLNRTIIFQNPRQRNTLDKVQLAIKTDLLCANFVFLDRSSTMSRILNETFPLWLLLRCFCKSMQCAIQDLCHPSLTLVLFVLYYHLCLPYLYLHLFLCVVDHQ